MGKFEPGDSIVGWGAARFVVKLIMPPWNINREPRYLCQDKDGHEGILYESEMRLEDPLIVAMREATLSAGLPVESPGSESTPPAFAPSLSNRALPAKAPNPSGISPPSPQSE